jgi:hypothetical protein
MATIHYVDDVCALGFTSHAIVGVWRGGLNAARFDAMIAVGEAAQRQRGEAVGSLSLVIQLPGGVDAQTRELSKALSKRMEPYSKVGAQVLEGTGLWMSAVRMMMSAVMVASGNRVPNKVFDKLDDGARWLTAQAGGDADALLEAVRGLKDELVKRPTPSKR